MTRNFATLSGNEILPVSGEFERSSIRGSRYAALDVFGNLLHINAGIGVSPPIRVRFRCPPEISVLTLRVIPALTFPRCGQPSRFANVASASALATASGRG